MEAARIKPFELSLTRTHDFMPCHHTICEGPQEKSFKKRVLDFLFFKIFEPRVSHTIPVDIRLDNFDMIYEFDTNIESLGLGYNPFMIRQPVYHTFMTH